MDESVETWFAREILAHEDALVRYLRRCWPHADDILDLRQETYIRVYEAARRERPYQPKSFLFTAARHLMADRLRRGRIVSMEARGTSQVIRANVPLATMFGYATEMRSMTQGRATYTMQFARYEEVPNAISEEIMAKVAGKPAARAGTR